MKLKIRPALGVKIRDPITLANIPEAGCEVEASTYWVRLLQSGCVVEIEKKQESLLKSEIKATKEKQSQDEESK